MGRGLGVVQQRLLRLLEEAPVTLRGEHQTDFSSGAISIATLAGKVHGTAHPTEAQIRGLRTSLSGLIERGLVEEVQAPSKTRTVLRLKGSS